MKVCILPSADEMRQAHRELSVKKTLADALNDPALKIVIRNRAQQIARRRERFDPAARKARNDE
ncbi:hypothetical protein GCM10010946_34730 [Undibacterium squillarum]|uniref:Uncharacterized protein n=1 Tax=Undibacterium squillarum TaxID=1131567 RepID=A0ABQ2Y2Q6_9BURK|nr:hypothetical protein GCM10010946_34730 [Undibacterium squillarum]